jgi:3-dehydroquinate synthase
VAKDLTVIVLPPGEEHKNLQAVERGWRELAQNQFDRQSLLIALGGGVVGDLVGFLAATYMRGIDFIQIPTTIIAQADSSIGGKTGFDFEGRKNHIGAFWQPRLVFLDVDTLATLPEREYRQGLAEIVKHGLIADRELLNQLPPNPLVRGNLGVQESLGKQIDLEMLIRSLEIKRDIVQEDELEKSGRRKLLNFGHTLGHAVESWSWEVGQGLLHGEAISIGMVGEAWLSWQLGYLSQADFELVRDTLSALGLPIHLPSNPDVPLTPQPPCQGELSPSTFGRGVGGEGFDTKDKPPAGARGRGKIIARILELIQADKKNVGGEVRWTLLKEIGQGVADVVVPEELVEGLIELK